MKLLFLHGAVKNAGDFLISHRSQMLVKYLIPNCEIIPLWEGSSESLIANYLKEVKGIVFGGGPFFTHHIYPHDIPLVKNLSSLSIPMINIGGGWYGANNSFIKVKDYFLDDTSIAFLKKIEASAGCLSCRDWYTVNMLTCKGFKAEMHGCPAWYDISYKQNRTLFNHHNIKRIAISDPGNPRYLAAARTLINCLKKLYPKTEILFVFHRGTWGKGEGRAGELRKKGIEKTLVDNNIKWVDISNSYEGFSVYDSCDLHIGFRVHAHIYNLSHKRESILLEEDGRGAGVNQAVGLPSIHVYDEKRQQKSDFIRRVANRIMPVVNKTLGEEVELLLNRNQYTEFFEYKQAFERMDWYFKAMVQHVKKIKEW